MTVKKVQKAWPMAAQIDAVVERLSTFEAMVVEVLLVLILVISLFIEL